MCSQLNSFQLITMKALCRKTCMAFSLSFLTLHLWYFYQTLRLNQTYQTKNKIHQNLLLSESFSLPYAFFSLGKFDPPFEYKCRFFSLIFRFFVFIILLSYLSQKKILLFENTKNGDISKLLCKVYTDYFQLHHLRLPISIEISSTIHSTWLINTSIQLHYCFAPVSSKRKKDL